LGLCIFQILGFFALGHHIKVVDLTKGTTLLKSVSIVVMKNSEINVPEVGLSECLKSEIQINSGMT
jgi:hypothetical protein